jgi:hypothetical protein
MAKRFMVLALVLASFAAVAPAAVVYGRGYGYGARVYAAPRYYYGPRVYAAPYVAPYVAPVYPAYGYGYRGYAPRYYGGGYYRGGGYARGYRR